MAGILDGFDASCELAVGSGQLTGPRFFVRLTDLAGAEPTPLTGSEKFVVKFPHPVLGAFLKSFGVVQKLADASETKVFEDYLKMRWEMSDLGLASLPPDGGDQNICKCRMLCMAQASAKKVQNGPSLVATIYTEHPTGKDTLMGIDMMGTHMMGHPHEEHPTEKADRDTHRDTHRNAHRDTNRQGYPQRHPRRILSMDGDQTLSSKPIPWSRDQGRKDYLTAIPSAEKETSIGAPPHAARKFMMTRA